MHPLSRLSHIPASFTRNKNLDTSPSHSGNHTSDSSSDSAIHVHRAPLAQIDQQLFNPAPTDIISPALTPLSTASFDSIPLTTRTFGKSMTPRRSSYTAEDILYSAGNGSQNSVHRRSSQYVFKFTFPLSLFFPSSLQFD
ncbi:hypothetical protein BGW80DRAFT_638085 [Lactifluus volemus]|nr:hypothetical protein BGW80DRAFT_638085 [Lactifluus volemus]